MKEAKNISRRGFLSRLGAGTAVAAATLAGCRPERNPADGEAITSMPDIPTGQMTYRVNPKTGENVSVLGYGCMRWPQTTDENGEEVIDQEAVNALVD
ncbi:MAG: twin-arginine translocation signal domain-containing protein, partial [Muribaculaceae bacterium]|nr:twin-arginine translocation signal domain-containing protein [Muribaculaceae bacterium]